MLKKEYKNIILRMPNHLGDLVMATPVIYDLKKRYPDSTLTVMVQNNLAELLKKDPNIDEIFTFEKPKSLLATRSEKKNCIQKLKEAKYDLGILLTNSFSSAWLFYQGKVENIIGYKKDFRNFLLDVKIPFNQENIHQIKKYKLLLKSLDIDPSNTRAKLYLDDEDKKNAKELLYQRGYLDDYKLIGINPFAKYGPAKCWPLEKFKEISFKLLENEKNMIVFFSDKENEDTLKKLCLDMPERVINLAGQTNLRELASVISCLDVLLTNDSGPMHIAAALDISQIALFGSTSDIATGPFSEKAIVINKQVDCSPCFKKICPIDFRCMKRILVEDVYQDLLKILHKK